MNTPTTETTEYKRNGITVLIRPTLAKGATRFVADFKIPGGKRKLVWRSSMVDARAAANDACDKIANGHAAVLDLTTSDRNFYLRAVDAALPTGKPVDLLCMDAAEALAILGGKATLAEACREYAVRHQTKLAHISAADATAQMVAELEKENRSEDYVAQIKMALKPFAEIFNGHGVDTITAKQVSAYLKNLAGKERTKANSRDYIGKLNRWLMLNTFLPKTADWLDGVQKYSKKKSGEVNIFAPEEIRTILQRTLKADKNYLPVIAIGAFSALRHSEIVRLKWEQVELADKAGESFIEVLGGKNERHGFARRLVPVSDNLKAWLKLVAKKTGPVCDLTFKQSKKHLPHVVAGAGVTFKRNALRDSGISYKVAQTGDVARVADDSGNSPAVIRSNYLKRVKPAQAAEWFNVMPT